jgi:ubiquinone/menaquinone biosynthesis C-methylase UbiE
VERERDQWQRASDIITQLNIGPRSRVVDLGCGAGYFALKLSAATGAEGTVQAVDILRLPLVFLWIRARQRDAHNVRAILGDQDDPRIPGPVDAVLIANTFHELRNPKMMLTRLHQALVTGGRIVIADRGTESSNAAHAIDPSLVDAELRRDGFEIVSRQDHFLDQPGEGPWWLIVARKESL